MTRLSVCDEKEVSGTMFRRMQRALRSRKVSRCRAFRSGLLAEDGWQPHRRSTAIVLSTMGFLTQRGPDISRFVNPGR